MPGKLTDDGEYIQREIRNALPRAQFLELTIGTIPGGFRMKDGHYENICPYTSVYAVRNSKRQINLIGGAVLAVVLSENTNTLYGN